MTWALIDNPSYAGRKPTKLQAVCHDGTPFITIQCSCGEAMHVHESQLASVPAYAEMETRCKACADPLIFPAGYFANAFAQLRAQGWLA